MSDIVDQVAQLAARAEPPGLDDSGARRLVERAMLARADAPPAEVVRTPIGWKLAVVALAVVALLAWIIPRNRGAEAPHADRTAAAEVSRVRLPTGDELIAATGATYELEELQPTSRRLRLRTGSIVVDVARVAAGQRFEVITDDVRVIATGTVFSVSTDSGRTRVHVFEGHVEVEHAGARVPLGEGESWPRGDRAPASVLAAGEAAAAKRTAVAVAAAPVAPSVTPPTAATPPMTPHATPPTATPPPAPAPASIERAPRAADAITAERTERPATAPEITTPPEQPSEPPSDTLDAARAHVAAKRFDAALAMVERTQKHGALDGAWQLVRGDALRGLGRERDASDAFDAAATALTGADRVEAAYTAAYLRFQTLGDATAALATLDRFKVDTEGSLLEERGLALRVRALVALKKAADARTAAERYLLRFPAGGMRTYMRSLTKP